MRHLSLGLAALLSAFVPFASARDSDKPLETIEAISVLAVEGDAYINADGSLADYRIDTPAPGDTAANVVRIAKGWQFEPVMVDGKAQAVVVRMRVALAATQVGEAHEVRVDNVTFPGLAQQTESAREAGLLPNLARNRTGPIYPPGLWKSQVAGRVLVAIRYDETGKVLHAAAMQSMLFDRRESEAVTMRAIELFEGAALEAARQWRIQNAATAEHRIAVTNVDFVLDHSRNSARDAAPVQPGRWRLVSRTPRRYIEWMDTRAKGTPSVSDVTGGNLVPVAEAPVRLRGQVIGTLL